VSAGSSSLRRRALPAAAALGALGYMLFESQWVRRADETIAIDELPAGISGLTIALLADFHAGFRPSFNLRAIRRAIDIARAAHPDLVVIAGDLAGGPANLGKLNVLLRRLDAPLGVYAVYGNHDRGHSKVPWVSSVDLSGVEDQGVRLLVNETVTIPYHGVRVQICGIDDFQHERTLFHELQDELDRRPDTLRLLLSHYGQAAAAAEPGAFALTLSGDTHGGQIRVPTWKGTVMLSQPRAQFMDGFYLRDGRRIYVTRGVGTSLLPLRLLTRPEVVILTLVQGEGPKA
jgi:uncharacterized protein